MLSDKLVGPKVRLVLLKFLPSLFVEALSDSCETAIHMFDNNHENPELVWNLVVLFRIFPCVCNSCSR